MKKQLKYVVICMISMMVLLGAAGNVKAAGFKGNLNVTYKNSDSKITIKKINSKKVKIKVKTSFAEGDFTGKVISNKVIKMNTGSKYAKVSLKWLDKNHFKTIWQEKNENIDEFISNFSGVGVLGNNTKYTRVK